MVIALVATAAGTVLLFFWPDVPLALAGRCGRRRDGDEQEDTGSTSRAT